MTRNSCLIVCAVQIALLIALFAVRHAVHAQWLTQSTGAVLFEASAILIVVLAPFGWFSACLTLGACFMARLGIVNPDVIRRNPVLRFVVWTDRRP